jgi:hypothetical protein
MKLKELLAVVPKDYEISLADFDKDICTCVYGIKEDAIMDFAQKTTYTKEQIENMDVIAINPSANVCCKESYLFADDMTLLHVKTQLLIEIQ